MKCEKCKEREANFFYTATINGKTTQRHLCTECAKEEGFDQVMDFESMPDPEDMFQEFWSPMGMLGSFFGGRPYVMAPAMVWPRFQVFLAPAEESEPGEDAADKIPQDAGEAVQAERERTALQAQLDAAVAAEDFEKAIELRDRLRAMDAK